MQELFALLEVTGLLPVGYVGGGVADKHHSSISAPISAMATEYYCLIILIGIEHKSISIL
jgi:hypothetical protein